MDVDVTARLRGVINRLFRQFNASATGEGLTPSQASALGLIAWRGPLSLAQLAEMEGLNPTMVSRIVGKLDEAGLARRVQNPQDLRAGLLEITEAGESMHERIKAERGKVVAEGLGRLTEVDRQAIIDVLPALEALAGALRSVPAPRS
jgi:DNA-binding MarR family transcriptional regulator